jgi:hypothetical protein
VDQLTEIARMELMLTALTEQAELTEQDAGR